MKDQEAARRLLYALSDVNDEYIEEATCWETANVQHGRGKIVSFPHAIRYAAVAAACLILVLVGVKTLQPQNPSIPEPPTVLDCNPVAEVSSMLEAEALVGFGLTYLEPAAPYVKQSIIVYTGTIIEINFTDQSDTGYSIRKAKGEGDISGDYSEYALTKIVTFAGVDVTLKGDEGQWYLAIWQKNGYTYALGMQEHPLSAEDIQALISGVD